MQMNRTLCRDRWLHGSLRIELAPNVPLGLVRRMQTKGQRIENRVIQVTSGAVRDTACDGIACRAGDYPFYWNKNLIDSVRLDAVLVWPLRLQVPRNIALPQRYQDDPSLGWKLWSQLRPLQKLSHCQALVDRTFFVVCAVDRAVLLCKEASS